MWALGCTFYKLAFGRTPFEDPAGSVQKMAILNGNVSFPHDSPYSEGLHDLIRACLVVDPGTRPTVFDLLRLGASSLHWPHDTVPAKPALPSRSTPPIVSDMRSSLVQREVPPVDAYASISGVDKFPVERATSTAEVQSEDESDSADDADVRATAPSLARGSDNVEGAPAGAPAGGGVASSASSGVALTVTQGVNSRASVLGAGVQDSFAETLQTRLLQVLGQKRLRWVIKATSLVPGPPKGKYVRRLVLDAWDHNSGGATIEFLPRRPVSTRSIVAAKACALLLKLWQRGPPAAFQASQQLAGFLTHVSEEYMRMPTADSDADPEFVEFISQFAGHLRRKLAFVAVFPTFDAHYADLSVEAASCDAVLVDASRGVIRGVEQVIALLESGIDVIRAAFLVGNLAQDIISTPLTSSGNVAGIVSHPPTLRPAVACAVGCLPPLVVETYDAYASSCAKLARVLAASDDGKREDDEGPHAWATTLVARTEACGGLLRKLFRDIRRLYAHPVCRLYMDALDALPEIGPSPFSGAGSVAAAPDEGLLRNRTTLPSTATQPSLLAPVPVGSLSLASMLRVPGNDKCCECSSPVGGAAWASVNLGLILCLRCSGVHRGLGVHISQVRSTTLDSWKPEWIQMCTAVGNTRANLFWEAQPAARAAKPSASSSVADVVRWCADKYTLRRFSAGGPPPHERVRATCSPVVSATTVSNAMDSFSPFRQPSTATAAVVTPSIDSSTQWGTEEASSFSDFGASLPFDDTDHGIRRENSWGLSPWFSRAPASKSDF